VPVVADLPVVEALPALRAALADARRAVLVAPPGAGKTTGVPLDLLDAPWLARTARIVVLEPRRLATRAAARRMAELLGEEVGDTVGYQTRDERRIGPATRIEVVTEGILTRRLQGDPELPSVGIIVFDEVHERNLTTDLGLALTLDVASTLRPDVRILAMSATPDTARLATLLGSIDAPAPVIESTGRTHPIDVRWVPRHGRDRLEPAVVEVVRRALVDEVGDVLVFLPGIGEIRRVDEQLAPLVGPDVDVHLLAGALSTAEQDAAIAPAPPGRRKVVLATDIAETSLTVLGVRVVVDAGLARVPRHDLRTGMTRLTTISTSRASADQRAGRAGRTEPGVAYRMWSKLEHGTRAAHIEPEITQVDLAGLALELAAWGTPATELAFPDPPPPKALRQAIELLTMLDAVDDGGRLTALGRRMLDLPVHPRLARMVAAQPSTLSCIVATLVDERDVLRGRPDELPTDLAMRVRLVAGSDRHPAADRRAVERVGERARELARRAGVRFDLGDVDADRTGAALLLAFPDRLARRRRVGQFQLRTGSGAWLSDDDPLAHAAFAVAADLDGKRQSARIRLAAALDPATIATTLAADVTERAELVWDIERDDLVERVERRLGALRLDELVRPPRASAETIAALVARVRATRLAALGRTDSAAEVRDRVGFLRHVLGEPWPDWSDATLLASLDEWLTPYLTGATSATDLRRIDLAVLLRAALPWPLGAELDDLAPPALELPRGRRVAIDYADARPTARVRVQDLYGTTTHPTVAAGRVAVVLELLSPADRPIQVTADLAGFWRGSWADVRKEMAGRYPKHHWPIDPSAAPPRRPKER
jgi:ATP-dependent helicase HrpB